MEPIGTGLPKIADTGQQEGLTLFLQSGAKLAELDLLLTASDAPLTCGVTGTATLVGS